MKVARVYDQLTATGQGTVDIANPVNTDGLRDLEELGDVEVEDGKAVTKLEVDGEDRLRTVSSFDEKDLPVTIKPTYELDGKVYDDPEDLVGKSGELKVTYRVENTTSEPTTITVQDGKGEDVEQTIDVPMPSVGSLVTVLPKGFYSVRSDQANISADGRGGTRMTYTMTLLPPIASTVAELSYTAQVEDAIIPKATVSIAVVQPLKNPSLSTAAASYQGGADTGATLTAGAEEIDSNLLKLRDGAGQLLGGLIQLRDGAEQLNDGLAGEAAPGARRLADGAGEAAVGADKLASGLEDAEEGSGDLADGVGQIADGNGQLSEAFNSSTGAQDLVSGSQDLAAGLGLISGGLSQLAGVEGLPKAYAGARPCATGSTRPRRGWRASDRYSAGLQQIPTGSTDSPQLRPTAANAQLQGGVTQLRQGADQLASPTTGLPAAKAASTRSGRASSTRAPPRPDRPVNGIKAGLGSLQAAGCDATCQGALGQAQAGLDQLLAALSSNVSAAVAASRAGVHGLGNSHRRRRRGIDGLVPRLFAAVSLRRWGSHPVRRGAHLGDVRREPGEGRSQQPVVRPREPDEPDEPLRDS